VGVDRITDRIKVRTMPQYGQRGASLHILQKRIMLQKSRDKRSFHLSLWFPLGVKRSQVQVLSPRLV
jgi:hypothetical protein